MIKLSDYVMEFVAQQKVKYIFLLPGGGCMHLVDSLGRSRDLKYVCCLHEQVAAFAATAYAQYTNNLGVALVTTGPGGTNAITGVAAAWTDSIPILVISGQVKRSDLCKKFGVRTLGYQEVDIVSVVKPITKYAVTILEPKEIKYHLEKAIFLAKSGRPGPVWLDIPLDVQAAKIEKEKLIPFDAKEYLDRHRAYGTEKNLAKKVVKVIELLNLSKRPVIIAGYGIKVTNSGESFIKLVNKIKVPVLTTWKALDLLSENFNLYFGRPGCIAGRGANFILQNSDLVIAIGARLDYGQIGYSHETFAREARKIVVDVDAAELKKFRFKLDLGINISADLFIKEFLRQVSKVKKVERSDWFSRCKDWKSRYPVVTEEHWAKKDFASTYALVDALSDLSREDDLFVPENSGSASEIIMQTLRLKKGQRVITTNTLGAMGSGLPATIGACLASGRRVISVIGDGSLQINIQDLETVARLNLPIKYFILNNQGYASIRNTQRNYFGGFYVASGPSSGLTLPSTKKIAEAYRIDYFSIKKNKELKEKVKQVLKFKGPVICEVFIDPAEQTMPKLSSQLKPDGSMVSKPLEDLWPFLDREEFKQNMIIKPLEER